jgi:succinate dehydrogenase/fumarate reductase flavoprotein subunit
MRYSGAEVDVLVIGYGAAGAATAIASADAGARVLLVERQQSAEHTPSTRMSGGAVLVITDVEAGFGYMLACCSGTTDPATCRAWTEGTAALPAWLEAEVPSAAMGPATVPFRSPVEHPDLPGSDAITAWYAHGDPINGGAGKVLMAALEEAVATRAVSIAYGTRATRLVQEAPGRAVVGVELEDDTGSGVVSVRGGVVLACGGFEYDDELKRQYLKADPIYFYGNPGNTGDGVRMAQAAGADLWHMNGMAGRAIAHFPDFGPGFICAMRPGGFLLVDRDGRRYANEITQADLRHSFYYSMLHFDYERREYPRIPSYWVFDSRRLAAGPLTYTQIGPVGAGLYHWSEDNTAELSRGWISQGDTPEALARTAGMRDPELFTATLREYNAACASGVDPLGRPAQSLEPLDAPPYCCVPVYPGGTNTSGGPRRNARAEVLDPFGEPIPGLYAAGELGQAMGVLYPGDGANISDGLVFGRLAGEHAAARAREGAAGSPVPAAG